MPGNPMRGGVSARFDFSAADLAYARMSEKGARNLIRRAIGAALKPARDKQKKAWRAAGFRRRGKKLVRKAIIGAIGIKRGQARGARGARRLDGAAVGINYAALRWGYRQRVAHLLEYGTKRGVRARLISTRVNQAEAAPAAARFSAAVLEGIRNA